MTLSEINTIGSLYTSSNTAASSSSTTITLPSLTPSSEPEQVEINNTMTEEKTNHPFYYHDNYNDYKKSKKPYNEHSSCIDHEKSITAAATVIPIPVYIPTRPSSLPKRNPPSTTTSSSMTSLPSPKKKAKRWFIAALMVIVGLLIALTFIMIGLGKAIGHPHQSQPIINNANNITTIFILPTPTLSSSL